MVNYDHNLFVVPSPSKKGTNSFNLTVGDLGVTERWTPMTQGRGQSHPNETSFIYSFNESTSTSSSILSSH